MTTLQPPGWKLLSVHIPGLRRTSEPADSDTAIGTWRVGCHTPLGGPPVMLASYSRDAPVEAK